MRYLVTALFLVFLVLVLVFAVQNTATVPVQFLGRKATTTAAVLTVGSYLLGAVTGSLLVGFFRYSMREVRKMRD